MEKMKKWRLNWCSTVYTITGLVLSSHLILLSVNTPKTYTNCPMIWIWILVKLKCFTFGIFNFPVEDVLNLRIVRLHLLWILYSQLHLWIYFHKILSICKYKSEIWEGGQYLANLHNEMASKIHFTAACFYVSLRR